ncbi:MAG: ammonium transporter [Candidatus Anammoxibacter sp.]
MKVSKFFIFLALIVSCFCFVDGIAVAAENLVGDPTGETTLANPLGKSQVPIDFVWLLYCASIVFLMKAGVCFFGGFLRPKNMLNFSTHVFMDSVTGSLAFWFVGGAFLLGGSGLAAGYEHGNWFMGYSGFMNVGRAYDVTNVTFWVFNCVFCTISVSFIACAVAERMKLIPYIIVSIVFCAWIYPVFGHWVWGGGWLSKLPFGSGAQDFSGSSIVHMQGGVCALVGAIVVGPRIGKFNADGTPNFFKMHNVWFGIIGIIILWTGWFGFNPGATLLGTDLRYSIVCINTFLAAASAAATMFFLSIAMTGKVNIPMLCNATLSGLAAITCSCAFIPVWAAVIVGIVAAFAYRGGKFLIDWKFKIDDALDAVAVHVFAGAWGVLSLGVFADGTYAGIKGILYGDAGQLLAQFICVLASFVWALVNGFAIFLILKYTCGVRVTKEQEEMGLDQAYHGEDAYPGLVFEK